MIEQGRVIGVQTQLGLSYYAKTVVLTTGTFLAGLVHVGLSNYPAGRAGDPPSIGLAHNLRELGLPIGRLKTGTPPRIDGRSIDFSVMQEQHSDTPDSGVLISGARRTTSATNAMLDYADQ